MAPSIMLLNQAKSFVFMYIELAIGSTRLDGSLVIGTDLFVASSRTL